VHRPPPVPDAGSPASPGEAQDVGGDTALWFQGKRFHRDTSYVLDFVRKQQALREALAENRERGGEPHRLTGNASSR
jgi:hypothetical protein